MPAAFRSADFLQHSYPLSPRLLPIPIPRDANGPHQYTPSPGYTWPPHTCKCSWKRMGNTCDMLATCCMRWGAEEYCG
ncbi:hypothetical protein E2C01_013253 [Portunus trituberculatus]|uniref:Uncharacterized protein n=1 Tax=Portunus trituberculatus TaxID=210409 RepID=A0A5B7DGI8_PORTR|nr:hypothetical protein [Portunus trituberculatus]